MKMILLVHLFTAMVLLGCGWPVAKDKVKNFIPGIYIRHYIDEYTESYDTIIILPVTPDASDGYRITRRSRFEKVNDDGTKVPGYELKRWTGMYDDKSKTIWLQAPGKQIYFNPDKGELKIGTEPYKKIKL